MKKVHIVAAALALLSPCAAAQQMDEDMRTCLGPPGGRLESCSRIIARGGPPMRLAYAHAMRGWVQLSLPAAVEDFTLALELKPDLDPARVGRAIALLNSGQSERAIPDFTAVLEKYPDDVRLLVGRGDAYNNLKRYDEGIADFDRALALSPNDEEALNDRAWALTRQGRMAEAIAGYDRALAASGRLRALILANRCDAKSVAGDDAGALADCDAAIALKPDQASYRAGRGAVHLRAGRLEKAVAEFEEVLAVSPRDTLALFGRGVVRLRTGATAEGQSDIEAAEQVFPKIRETMAEMGIRDH